MASKTFRVAVVAFVAAAAGGAWWVAIRSQRNAGNAASAHSEIAYSKTPVLRPLPSNPNIGGRCLPRLDVETPFNFRTSARGYRGPEGAVPKPKDTLRIVLAGGPLVFGATVANEAEMLGSQLQSLLVRNMPNRAIEVIAAGPGGTEEEAALGILELELGLDVDPTMLVWVVEREPHDPRLKSPRDTRKPWLGGLAVENWVWPRMEDSEPGDSGGPATRPGTAEWSRARDRLARRLARDLQEGYLPGSVNPKIPEWAAAIAAECKKRGITFAAALMPSPLESDSELRALAVAAVPEERRSQLFASVDFAKTTKTAEAIRALGVAAIDLTAILREGVDLRRMSLIDFATGAWNAKAANLAAAQIASHAIAAGVAK